MANAKGSRRRFGALRQLPSGQWQARYPGPDGMMRPADKTFRTKTEAAEWLVDKEAEIRAGDWINPEAGKITVAEYGEAWIKERPKLRPKTVQGYSGLLARHIGPYLGAMEIGEVKDPHIRRWRKQLVDAGVGEATIARAYQLLKSIFNTAVGDELIRRNPCRIKGGAVNETPERPVLTLAQVFNVAGEVPLRYRMLVLMATFASLRWGELIALERRDIDLGACTIRIRRQVVELDDGVIQIGPTKSAAGRRVVSFPEALRADLEQHLAEYVEPGQEGRIFTSWEGTVLRRANFQKIWAEAREAAGLSDVHVHDLRHTGNTLASHSGATLKELMQRMGHSTVRAALIYQHAADGRDRKIAEALDGLIGELKREGAADGESDEPQPDETAD